MCSDYTWVLIQGCLESPSTIDALSVSMGMKLTKIIIRSSQNPIQINEKRETLNRSVTH
ncbi:2285_t:CDS:2, partial [Funneliformis geosporum]